MTHDYSQHQEQKLVARFFRETSVDYTRFFVDVGAFDGVTGSNSRFLAEQGWRGMVIEPAPDVFRRLEALYEGNPSVQCVRCAVSDHSSPEGEMLISRGPEGVPEDDRWQYSQVSTLNDWFAQAYIDDHDYRYQKVRVPVRTLTEVLEEGSCPAAPGFICIDCEGEDLKILEAFEFSRYRPSLLSVESDDHNRSLYAERLRRHGYSEFAHTAANTFFFDSEAS